MSPAKCFEASEGVAEVRATGGCGCLLTIVPEMTVTRKPRAKARTLRSLELFTGAGGLALGTHLAGLDHVALLEWNGDACRTLR